MKTAVITGSSYGIGHAITQQLLAEGWKAYGLSRTKPAFDSEHFVWIKCDLSEPDKIAKSLEAISEPKIDALISNAGVIEIEMATAVTKTSYDWTFSINVLAPMLLVGALRDKIQEATVISVSSVSDRFPDADVALYASSKAANTLYFNSLAKELKEAKIYTLLPDYVDTPMQHQTSDDNPDFDWSATIKVEDLAQLTSDLLSGKTTVESGANIIIITEALKADLQNPEILYALNTDTKKLTKL